MSAAGFLSTSSINTSWTSSSKHTFERSSLKRWGSLFTYFCFHPETQNHTYLVFFSVLGIKYYFYFILCSHLIVIQHPVVPSHAHLCWTSAIKNHKCKNGWVDLTSGFPHFNKVRVALFLISVLLQTWQKPAFFRSSQTGHTYSQSADGYSAITSVCCRWVLCKTRREINPDSNWFPPVQFHYTRLFIFVVRDMWSGRLKQVNTQDKLPVHHTCPLKPFEALWSPLK